MFENDEITRTPSLSEGGERLPGRLSWAVWLAAAVIVLAGVLAYGNSLSAPFIFDDEEVIVENPHIRRLWPLSDCLSAPPQSAVAGRPFVALTLAINYCFSGLNPWGYRAFNVAVHILAALVLFGVLRRTVPGGRPGRPRGTGDSPVIHRRDGGATWLSGGVPNTSPQNSPPHRLETGATRFLGEAPGPGLWNHFPRRSSGLALVATLIWLLHPLQTESVTYIVQRSESMMGLLYLLTLYCAIRGAASARPIAWHVSAVVACGLGMATKEVMVTAPLLVLLYDRVFNTGSLLEALRRRWAFYAGLAATWFIVAALAAGGPRSESAGFGLERVTALGYAASQFGVILHYLKLCFWPASLCLDYGWPVAHTVESIVPPMLVVLALLAATGWAWRRCPPLGYPGLWFFLILAPSSSVIPILDLAFEHRMYLPLAAVSTLAVLALRAAWRRAGQILRLPPGFGAAGQILTAVVIVTVLGLLTVRRNLDYRSPMAMWADVVAKRPDNPRGHNNLATCLKADGRLDEVVAHLRMALRLRPDYDLPHKNLAAILAEQGRIGEALRHADRLVELRPRWAEAYSTRGFVLAQAGRLDAAAAGYRQALDLNADSAETNFSLANVLLKLGRADLAARHYARAVEIWPDYADALNNLAALLTEQGDCAEAIDLYARALRIKPDWAEAHENLGLAMAACGRLDEAVASYHRALELEPDSPEARYRLGNALLRLGRTDLAVASYQKALRLRPDYFEAHCNLASALAAQGDMDRAAEQSATAVNIAFQRAEELRAAGHIAQAVELHRAAVQIAPRSADAHYRLGRGLLDLGQVDEAIEALRIALTLDPNHDAAKIDLETAQRRLGQSPPSTLPS